MYSYNIAAACISIPVVHYNNTIFHCVYFYLSSTEQARRHKPCVVFIDELDAVGGARVASSVHPYSRMTLNQLLVEMDGYKELEGIVIIGATNFPESLDKLVQ